MCWCSSCWDFTVWKQMKAWTSTHNVFALFTTIFFFTFYLKFFSIFWFCVDFLFSFPIFFYFSIKPIKRGNRKQKDFSFSDKIQKRRMAKWRKKVPSSGRRLAALAIFQIYHFFLFCFNNFLCNAFMRFHLNRDFVYLIFFHFSAKLVSLNEVNLFSWLMILFISNMKK